jgi:hypothetical protein
MEQLIALKTAIIRANYPIQEAILRRGELSARIDWLKKLTTTAGTIRHGYQNTSMEYEATLKKADIDVQCRQMEKEIDQLQDQIDEYNVGKKIEVNQRALDLAS